MTDKTQAEAHACINPQCNPAKCTDCACAIPANDQTGHVVLDLLNTFAVNDLGHPFEDGDSAAVDRARQWLQNRSAELEAQTAAKCLHPVEALLFEHKDGRHAVNPDTAGDPDWHRVGPVMVYGPAALQAAPPAPAAVPVLYVSPEQFAHHRDPEGDESAEAGRYLPARKTPAGKFTQPLYALAAAPAQTVALPSAVELPDVEDMAHSAVQEALSFGVNHDVFHRWMRAVMDKTVQALAAGAAQAPEQWIDDPHDIEQGRMLNPEWVRAQEYATQLAGQGQTYSIDADPQGIRARVADAITGALASGVKKSDRPSHEHWLRPFWMHAYFAVVQHNALRDSAEAMLNAPGALTQAARDLLAERARQVDAEGFNHARDDEYVGRQLAGAAASYLILAAGGREDEARAFWPWRQEWLKPSDLRRYLEKAGALALAEMERLDRAAARAAQGGAA